MPTSGRQPKGIEDSTLKEFISFAREALRGEEAADVHVKDYTLKQLLSLAWKALSGDAAAEIDAKEKVPTGGSAAAFIRRLGEDRPDIHARVLAGELTPHAGMLEAGFRKKAVRKKLTILERAQKLVAKLTESERRQLWSELNEEFQLARRSNKGPATPPSVP